MRQPYASRIVSGLKLVENRPARTHVRGRLMIHAGAKLHDRYASYAGIVEWPMSSIVGSVQLVDCHPVAAGCAELGCHSEADGLPGSGAEFMSEIFHWVLADPIAFTTPIPRIKGILGFWTVDDSAAYLCQLAEEEARA